MNEYEAKVEMRWYDWLLLPIYAITEEPVACIIVAVLALLAWSVYDFNKEATPAELASFTDTFRFRITREQTDFNHTPDSVLQRRQQLAVDKVLRGLVASAVAKDSAIEALQRQHNELEANDAKSVDEVTVTFLVDIFAFFEKINFVNS